MDTPPSSWWWWVIGTAIPSIATALGGAVWAVHKDRQARTERQEGRRDTAEERHDAAIARERDQAAAATSAVIATLRLELEREMKARIEAEAERDREWNRSRRIYDYARHLCHEARHARQFAESQARHHKWEEPVWATPIDLPPFDPPPNP